MAKKKLFWRSLMISEWLFLLSSQIMMSYGIASFSWCGFHDTKGQPFFSINSLSTSITTVSWFWFLSVFHLEWIKKNTALEILVQYSHTNIRICQVGGEQFEKITTISKNMNSFKGFLVQNDEENLSISVEKNYCNSGLKLIFVFNVFPKC